MPEAPETKRRGRPKGSKNDERKVSNDSSNSSIDDGTEEELDEDPRYLVEVRDLEDRVQDSMESVWETESLFEDVLEDLADDKMFADGKSPGNRVSSDGGRARPNQNPRDIRRPGSLHARGGGRLPAAAAGDRARGVLPADGGRGPDIRQEAADGLRDPGAPR